MGEIIGPYSTRPGPRRKFNTLTIHAEDGFVYCQWDDGERDVLELPAAKSRMDALVQELTVWEAKKDNGGPGIDRSYAAEMYHNLRRSLENLRDTIEDARQQGDSTDPEVRVKKLVAFLRSRRANLNGDTSRVDAPSKIAEAIMVPVDYGIPKHLPKPRTGLYDFGFPDGYKKR